MSKKQPIDLIDNELLDILNRVFMDGGAAYREGGLFSRWRAWVHHSDWQNSMVRAADDIKRWKSPQGNNEGRNALNHRKDR